MVNKAKISSPIQLSDGTIIRPGKGISGLEYSSWDTSRDGYKAAIPRGRAVEADPRMKTFPGMNTSVWLGLYDDPRKAAYAAQKFLDNPKSVADAFEKVPREERRGNRVWDAVKITNFPKDLFDIPLEPADAKKRTWNKTGEYDPEDHTSLGTQSSKEITLTPEQEQQFAKLVSPGGELNNAWTEFRNQIKDLDMEEKQDRIKEAQAIVMGVIEKTGNIKQAARDLSLALTESYRIKMLDYLAEWKSKKIAQNTLSYENDDLERIKFLTKY
jgi:hypothetical protein